MSKKDWHPTEEWVKDLNRVYTKEDTQIANKYLKRSSTSLATGEMQIKTTKRHIITYLLVLLKIKKACNTMYWHGCRIASSLVIVG